MWCADNGWVYVSSGPGLSWGPGGGLNAAPRWRATIGQIISNSTYYPPLYKLSEIASTTELLLGSLKRGENRHLLFGELGSILLAES